LEIKLIILFFTLILGVSLGSFFNVCIYRLPRKLSIVFPSSFCPACNQPIKPWQNIPLLSFFLLRGKCASCGSRISFRYPLVELTTAILYTILLYQANFEISFVFFKYAVYISFGIIIFLIDLEFKIIPDSLSLPLIVLGLLSGLIKTNDISLANSFFSGLAAFTFFYMIALYYVYVVKKEGLGGGDIKLIAAIGAFVGIVGILFTLLSSSIIALIAIGIYKLFNRNFRIAETHIPFGPFLITGSTIYILWGQKIIFFYLNLFL